MDALIQYILDLFSNPAAASAFMGGPEQAMYDAGLVNVAPDQFALAAANALPGTDLGGDPVGGLQQVLTDQYGYAPGYGGDGDAGYGGYDPGYGGDGGYGGYDPGVGGLVGDAVAPLVYGADAGLGVVGDVAGGLLGIGSWLLGGFAPGSGYGWQPGFGGYGGGWGTGYGPGWGGPGWGGPGWGGCGPGTGC
ncbi:MAG: IniB N-terminal domain-containing protein, partial [Mycobacterium sp.]